MNMKIAILILLNMAPPQKLVLAPGAIVIYLLCTIIGILNKQTSFNFQ